jgi:hypothetical protein
VESADSFNNFLSDKTFNQVASDNSALVKAGLNQLIVTMKNVALYPDTNKTNIEAVFSLHHWLTEYLSYNSQLVLEVTKNQLLSSETVVYQEKPTEQILTAPLFRDGIQTLTFEEGLTEAELRYFLSVLLKFRNPTDSDQDDLVGSLWEANLTHIKYSISTEYEQVGPEFELTAMKAARACADFRDADAPVADGAIALMETEGGAPIAKPIASLFALAQSNFIKTQAGDSSDGMSLPAGSSSSQEDSGFAPLDSADSALSGSDRDMAGFGPMGGHQTDDGGLDGALNNLLGRHSPSSPTGSAGRHSDPNSSLAGKAGPGNGISGPGDGPGKGSGQGTGGGGGSGQGTGTGSSEGGSLASTDRSSGDGEKVSGYGGDNGAGDEDATLDIDVGSVAEAFKDLGQKTDIKPQAKENTPLTLAQLQARPVNNGPKLAERLKHWGLSSQESNQVNDLIKWDEGRNFSYDSMVIANVLMTSPILTEAYLPFLIHFLTNEIKNSIKRWDLKYFNSFFLDLRQRAATGQRLDIILVDELLKKLASQEVLNFLVDPQPTNEQVTHDYDALRYFLYQLPPPGIIVLTTLVPKATTPQLWNLFLEVIAYEVLRTEGRAFDLSAQLSDRTLVQVLNILKPNFRSLPQSLVYSLIKHKSAAVRETVSQALLESDPNTFHTLCAPLVLDPDSRVRKLVGPALSTRRNPAVESLLFNFLRDSYTRDRHGEDPKLLSCYRIYGLCASDQAVPFLEEVLLRKDFKSFISRTVDTHRLGAALALLLMPQYPSARKVLDKAGRSSFRNVRLVLAEAQKQFKG